MPRSLAVDAVLGPDDSTYANLTRKRLPSTLQSVGM